MVNYSELMIEAKKAREFSYSPYSNFKVGAALLCSNGKVYDGCNIENAAFSPTNCAERTAVFKAVSEGETQFDAIAIVGGKADAGELDVCAPCGVCRQVLIEFCNPDEFKVVLGKNENDYKVFTLSELLPLGFSPKNLK